MVVVVGVIIDAVAVVGGIGVVIVDDDVDVGVVVCSL